MRFGFFADGRDAGSVFTRNVQAALDLGAVLHRDIAGDHIADHMAGTADGDGIAAVKIARHLAENQDFAGLDVGGKPSVGANLPVARMDHSPRLIIREQPRHRPRHNRPTTSHLKPFSARPPVS
jgi:hypothetical protein